MTIRSDATQPVPAPGASILGLRCLFGLVPLLAVAAALVAGGCGGTTGGATRDDVAADIRDDAPDSHDTPETTAAADAADAADVADAAAADVPPDGPGGYWDGIARAVATTPTGHRTAVSCHNCYLDVVTPEANLTATLAMLHAAQAEGADFLELDVKYEGGALYVDHEDDGGTNGALLADVLADPALQAGDQVLFIEIKELTPDEAFVADLLDTLVTHGYATPGRPVVLRAFDGPRRGALAIASELLADPARSGIRDLVRLHVLYNRDAMPTLETFQASIRGVAADGYDGIELQYQDRNLLAKVALAHELGLAVNLWTIPANNGAVLVATLRDLVDVLTVDYDVDRTRAVIEGDVGRLLVDAAAQTAADGALAYHGDGATPASVPIGGPGAPDLVTWNDGAGLYGGVLAFDADAGDSLPFPDGVTPPGGGYLVTVAVVFGRLALEAGETVSLLDKTGAFRLDVVGDADGATMRFGVRAGGSDRYATLPVDRLNTTDSFLVTGAWDGSGPVRLWVDGDGAGTTTEDAEGDVGSDDAPIVLGAAPDAAAFDGAVQFVQVLRWGTPD